MTTSLSIPFSERSALLAAKPQYAVARIAPILLTLSFLLSFLQYSLERSDWVRLVPVGILIAGSYAVLVVCSREQRRLVLEDLARPSTLALISAASVPPLLSSLYRPGLYPFGYGIVMLVTLLAVRVLLSALGLEGLLFIFFYATTAGLLILVGATFTDLLKSLGSTRYAPSYFDPNRIAFFAATAVPIQIWYAFNRRRYYVLFLTALSLVVIVAAASRGSLGALLIGGGVGAFLYLARLLRYSGFRVSRNLLMGTLALLFAASICGIAAVRYTGQVGRYVAEKLELDNRARGLDSGFTGRTTGWAILLNTLPKTAWLTGNGYRTSDEDFNFSVDNGYLAGLYELGLFSTALILLKYGFSLYLLWTTYLNHRAASGSCLPVLFITMVIFFANAFVHRVLFGFGEQASLLALFAFISTRQDVLSALRLRSLRAS